MQSITLKSDLRQLATVSDWLQRIMSGRSIPVRTMSQLELLVTEAVTNVIEHAYPGRTDENITVSVDFDRDDVVIRVVDNGRPSPTVECYNNAQLPDASTLPENGWGMGLINTIADQVRVERCDGQNTTVLLKNLSGDGLRRW